ncbi:hypothetical protein JCM11641_002494 [Rhodosporidiobolus odoratus]
MSYAWNAAHAQPAAHQSITALPSLAEPPLRSSFPSLAPPSLPLAPPAADLHGARIKLTLNRVKLELEAVKASLGEVRELGKAVEANQEEIKSLKEMQEDSAERLAERILPAVRSLLASRFEPHANRLSDTKSSILQAIATSEQLTKKRVAAAEQAAKLATARVTKVEKDVKGDVTATGLRLHAELEQLEEGLDSRLQDLVKRIERQTEEAVRRMSEVEQLNHRVELVESELANIRTRLSARPPSGFQAPAKAILSSAGTPSGLHSRNTVSSAAASPIPAAQDQRQPLPGSSSSGSVTANSPPRRLGPRHALRPRPHTSSLPNLPIASSTPCVTAAVMEPRRITVPGSRSTTSVSSLSRPIQYQRTPTKRRLLEQSLSQGDGHKPTPAPVSSRAGLEDDLDALSSLSSLASSPEAQDPLETTSGKKKRRRIEQDLTPAGTQEGEPVEVVQNRIGVQAESSENKDATGGDGEEEEPDTQE